MAITFTEEKKFTEEQVRELFLSVGWVSGQYPSRVYKALMNSSTVITAWDEDKLVALIRVLDDSEMLAYIHYVVVYPDYQHMGIGKCMVEMIKEKYKNYLYIEVMPDESKNAAYYQRFGFKIMADGVPMQLCNFEDKR